MPLKIIKTYLTQNDCYKTNKKITPIGIQYHTIGTAQNTAQSLADYWNQPGISACVHYAVDAESEGKVLQFLPEDHRSWADAGYGNSNLITIEGMESDYMRYTGGAGFVVTDEARFRADIKRSYNGSVLLCAKICKKRGWNPIAKLPSGLYLLSSHDEGRRLGVSSAHVDPTHIWDRLGYTMDGFRSDVLKAIDGKIPEVPAASGEIYRVRKTWADAASQRGAYEYLDNAKSNCPAGYSVFNNAGKVIYTGQSSSGAFTSEQDFINQIGKLATQDMKTSGIPASVTTAQAILESGYGSTELARNANNFFGMKCMLSGNTWPSVWDGKSRYTKKTEEQDANGNSYYVKADFRKYPDILTSLNDHSCYLNHAMNGGTLRYKGLKGEKDYRKAAQIIKNGGYATDVKYVQKICSLIERWDLIRFDSDTPAPAPQPEPAKRPDKSSFKVRVAIPNLNIRTGPGLKHSVTATCPIGTFTILETKKADSYTWGRLKSGAGWIALEYTSRI